MDLHRRIALWIVVVWVTVALATTTAGAAPTSEQATVPPPAGQPAPGFDLSLLSGKKVALKEFRGKAVLIVFWQSGEPPVNGRLPFGRHYTRHTARAAWKSSG